MKLAKVIGTVVATQKDKSLLGCKILMIQPLTDEMKSSDSVGGVTSMT
ncbi:MAG: EutN/CcmL family microcompartment protein [Thaumarchaeota archaeon]|nr:EutN/CcmL family microcompartment protein [Nitrososphaerota archaeon]